MDCQVLASILSLSLSEHGPSTPATPSSSLRVLTSTTTKPAVGGMFQAPSSWIWSLQSDLHNREQGKFHLNLFFSDAINAYMQSKNRLLILGFNGAMTKPLDILGGRGEDQIKEMEPKLHPDLKGSLMSFVVIQIQQSWSSVVVIEASLMMRNFGEYSMWLTAENGMFL